jgi:hypothetical protein
MGINAATHGIAVVQCHGYFVGVQDRPQRPHPHGVSTALYYLRGADLRANHLALLTQLSLSGNNIHFTLSGTYLSQCPTYQSPQTFA